MTQAGTVWAIGFFDGVHLGHQALLRECRALAERQTCPAGVLTFDTHPDALVLGKAPPLLNTAADQERLLRRYGADEVVRMPFDRQTKDTPWQDFFRRLRREYGAAGLVCGSNFRFGAGGKGTPELLKSACLAEGIPCTVVEDQTMEGTVISSTCIRRFLEAGQAERAAAFLGHPHLLTGTVVQGRRLGRTLGIPTANLALPPELLRPRFGVYASTVQTPAGIYPAVTNVGTRPTVSGEGVTAESWLLDFDGDLYGREITVLFHAFLRPEEKFPTLAALQEAIRRDGACTRDYFSTHAL